MFWYLRPRANLREESRCKTEVRLIFSNLKKVNPSLSNRALGMAIRRAFPAVVRRKVGPVHYYFGLKLISVHSEEEVSSSKSPNNVADPVRNEITSPRGLPGKGTCAAGRNRHDTEKNKRSSMGTELNNALRMFVTSLLSSTLVPRAATQLWVVENLCELMSY